MSHEHDESCGCGLTASAYRDGDGNLVVQTNIAGHPDGEPFARALLAHANGRDELAKAKRVDPFSGRDWKYPALDILIQKARRDMLRWGPDLLRELLRLYDDGKLYPLTPDREAMLRSLFRDRENDLVVRVTGMLDGRPVPPSTKGYQEPSHLEASFRLGRGLDLRTPGRHYKPAPEGTPAAAFEQVLEMALKVPLDERDVRALQYVQRKTGEYVRKPLESMRVDVDAVLLDTERKLTDAETDWLKSNVTEAIAERLTAKQLEQQLRRTLEGNLSNDLERIALTELRSAHAYGSYRTLKENAAEAGVDDPYVYKMTSPTACVQCVRIWGRRGSHRYLLSEVEAWEAAGGNFKKPAADWGPTIGPVHPRCMCGPLLMFTSEREHREMVEANDEMLADWRRELGERGNARLPDDTIVGGSA